MQPTLTPGDAAVIGEATGLAAGDDEAPITGDAAGEGAEAAGDAAGAVVDLLVGGAAVDPLPHAVSSKSGATLVTHPRIAARREIRACRLLCAARTLAISFLPTAERMRWPAAHLCSLACSTSELAPETVRSDLDFAYVGSGQNWGTNWARHKHL
jgi:hypothetical protein